MLVTEHASLRELNTLRLAARARFLVELASLADIHELLHDPRLRGEPRLILGGGSNLVLRSDFAGVVARVGLRGIEITRSDRDASYVRAAAGESWQNLVNFTLARDIAGLENLSLIPGTVGAAPMQNIGAYGVELSHLLHSVEVVDTDDGTERRFSNAECGFGYRDSLFKRRGDGRFLITAVTLRLPAHGELETGYPGVMEELRHMGVSRPDARSVGAAVSRLRRRKLPDPGDIGNVGSFFKNPLVSSEQCARLRAAFPDLPVFALDDGGCKVSAAWMIEQLGWKGHRRGDAGVYEHHALVMVNHGAASGTDIHRLAREIHASVERCYGLSLLTEPVVIGGD